MSEQACNKLTADGRDKASVRWDLVLAVVLILPLALFYLAMIDRLPFHDGEYRTIYNVRESLAVLMADRLKHAHQPLFFLVAWVCARVFGSDSLLAMRILPQAACFVALAFLYCSVRTIANRYAAVLAVALCMLTDMYMWVSHNVRPASFLAMFAMALVFTIVSSGDNPSPRRRALIGLLAFLALMSYNAAIPVIAIMMVGVLFVGPARWRLLLPLTVAIIVFIPWFIYTTTWYAVSDRLGWLAEGDWMDWPGAILDFTYNFNLLGTARNGKAWAFALACLAWLAHIALIVYGFSRSRRFGPLLGLMWFFPLLCGLFSLVVLDANTMKVDRYFTITVMCQAIGLAIAITSLPQRLAWLRAAAFVGVLAAAGTGLAIELKKPAEKREMDLVYYIRDHTPDADAIYVVQHSRIKYQLEYFLDIKAYMLGQVFGMESNRNIEKYGNEAIEVGKAMSPPPHQNARELVIIEYRHELDPTNPDTRVPASPEMREKVHDLFAEFEQVQTVTLESGRIHILRNYRPKPAPDQTTPPTNDKPNPGSDPLNTR